MEENHNFIEKEEEKIHDLFADAPEDTNATVSTVPVIPQLCLALGLLVFVFSITYIGATNSLAKKVPTSTDANVVEALAPQIPEQHPTTYFFKDTTVRAKSAIVWDVREQRVLFNKNADAILPLASITKLMTALIAYDLLHPDDTVTITQDALKADGDSGLSFGERFSMQDLADFTLISSSNDGARALGAAVADTISDEYDPEAVFVQAMNVKAEELGLTKTSFSNSTGLDISETEAGAYGSARDVALLMEYITMNVPDVVSLTSQEKAVFGDKSGASHTAQNTNEITENIEGLIASKTGYTDLSGGNLVVAVNVGLNHPIIVVVLGSSQEGRFSDTLTLVNQARASITEGAHQ